MPGPADTVATPARDHWVERPAIRLALDRPPAWDVSVVVAPAGFGKSTAIAQWARHHSIPLAWVTAHTESAGAPALAADIEDGLARGATTLVVSRAERLRDGVVRSTVEDWLTRTGDTGRVVVDSRVAPDLRLPERRGVRWIGPELLRFSATETQAVVHRVLDGTPSKDAGAALHRVSGGWPALVVLAAAGALGTAEPGSVLAGFSARDDVVLEYVAEQVVDPLPPAIADALLRLAALPEISHDLLARALDTPDAEGVIRALRCRRLTVSDDGVRAQLLPVLQVALGEIAQRRIGTDLDEVRRAGDDWLAARGQGRRVASPVHDRLATYATAEAAFLRDDLAAARATLEAPWGGGPDPSGRLALAALHAIVLAHAGAAGDARGVLSLALADDDATRDGPLPMLVHYALACVAARLGDLATALVWLEDVTSEQEDPAPLDSWVAALAVVETARVHAAANDRAGALQALVRTANQLDRAPAHPIVVRTATEVAAAVDVDLAGLTRPEPLSAGDRALLQLLRGPLTGPAIARELGVPYDTFRSRRRLLYRRLGVNTREEAAWRAADLPRP